MYQALYRKYRPLSFSDVLGQDNIVLALKSQILHSKIGHSYIFTGSRGTGKTSCAKIFAKAVNCELQPEGDACCSCSICRSIDANTCFDIEEIDAASNNGVDFIRDLREQTSYAAAICKFKVYIIDEVHMLSTQAFNALLKIMEEPPPHIVFILATTEIHKVPVTIISRCQRFDFRRISINDIVKRIKHITELEKISITDDACQLVAKLADGAMRDALSLLDTLASTGLQITEQMVLELSGTSKTDYLFEISALLEKGDISKVIQRVSALRAASKDMKRLCEELIYHYRNLLLFSVNKNGELLYELTDKEKELYFQSTNESKKDAFYETIKILSNALERMPRSSDQRLELELSLFEIATPKNTVKVVQPKAESLPVQALQPKETVKSEPIRKQENTGLAPFAEFEELVSRTENEDALLFSYLKNSRAYVKGKTVLIDGSELFLQYLKTNEHSRNFIKKKLLEITGTVYGIGPYVKETIVEKKIDIEDTIRNMKEQGVTVVEE